MDAKIYSVFNSQGRQMLLAFLTIVMRWPCSTPNFQNLIGEFMWKYFAAFGNFFTQIAEADGVFCHLMMVLTVFFHWMNKIH